MADSASAQEAAAVECGFCIQKVEDLVNPKTLPCLHVHCLRCLTDYYDRYSMLECPFCSKTCKKTPDSLPAANIGEDNTPLCDICLKKGVNNIQAVAYCKTCTKTYCLKHQESHDDLNDDHAMISIDDYKGPEKKMRIQQCTEHKDHVYIMGCQVCLKVFCAECLSGTENDTCTDGTSHKRLTLDALAKELTKGVDQMKGKLVDREEKLAGLSKLISKTISDYDVTTDEMVNTLHNARDEQLSAIRQKYDLLEAELIEQRKKSKSEITEFKDEDVEKQLLRMSNYRMGIEARLQQGHQVCYEAERRKSIIFKVGKQIAPKIFADSGSSSIVDVINGFRGRKAQIEKLLDEDEPSLQLEPMIKLETKAEQRDIELELVAEDNEHVIDLKYGLTSKPGLRRSKRTLESITLLDTTQLKQGISVCHHNGVTYVGREGGKVARIYPNYKRATRFVSLNNPVEGMTWYKGRMYTLVYGDPFRIDVYDDSGKLTNQWNHTDPTVHRNKLTIVGDRIVIPDRTNERLTVYSLTGEVEKSIPCPSLSDSSYLDACEVEDSSSYVAVCTVENESVIVSDSASSQVCKVSISTGEIVWTSTAVRKPQGVTCYGENQVCIYSGDDKFLVILNSQTGQPLRKITDSALTYETMGFFDLHIFGDVLVAPGYNSGKVLFYKLK